MSFTVAFTPASRESDYERVRKREKDRSAKERNNIVPLRDLSPSGELPGGVPPAAFLETKRKLEETGGDWFQPAVAAAAVAAGIEETPARSPRRDLLSP